jgi:proton-dependent oligopeptide transporter, POT family
MPIVAESTSTLVADRVAEEAPLFGHPRGLTFLFSTEMWERFSYYGMRSLLVLYMTKYLLLPDHAGHVAGLLAVKHALESVLGPLDVQPLSAQIWGLYTGLIYFTPIFGGLLADRVLGQRRTVVIGAVLMAIGHFMMAVEHLFLVALVVLIVGSGCFKPNISTQVGGLYPPGDHRRDRAYSIFYVGINVGALLAPLVCGTLGEKVGWHYGFAAAGVGMCLGLVIYLSALPYLPQDEFHKVKAGQGQQAGFSRDERRAIIALLVLFVPNTLFWATYEQMGVTTILWIDSNIDRTVDLFGWTAQIPTTWFLAVNPFMIVAFTPFVVALWAWQAKRGTELSTISKMALGCVGVTLADLIKAFAAFHADGGQATWLWVLASTGVTTVGELYLSPVGLSLVTKAAPARILSMMMGIWLATGFVGNVLSGYIGSYWSRMDKPEFFLMTAAIGAVAGLMIFACRWPLRGALKE